MAHWTYLSIRDVITKIEEQDIVLPVIQRRLEWNEEQMELLFDSLFRQNSFGSIVCIEEDKGKKPLFAYRPFTVDGTSTLSQEHDTLDRNILLVIDGQQRLQSFYMGLCGTYKGKTLYYDLLSNCDNLEFNFRFEASEDKLPRVNKNSSIMSEHLWYSAPRLFSELKANTNSRLIAKNIVQNLLITDSVKEDRIRENVKDFSERIFADESIGISRVNAHMSNDILEDRARITELFRRLNDGGTKLSAYDLLASSLKCFDYSMESFIEDNESKYSDIGINKDVLINLLLVLNDKPDKSMADMDDSDAKFITGNRGRIEITLEVLKKFLEASKHTAWFGTTQKRSVIPLYFLAYHIFYDPSDDEELTHIFDNYDVGGPKFSRMLKWLKLSLLNHVFSYGCGWRANIKGMRLIHEVMRKNKGKDFPLSQLFKLYRANLHYFYDEKQIKSSNLGSLDEDYIFYLIYERPKFSIRVEDKDHIQPSSLLREAGFPASKIDSVGNFQLIDVKTNRGGKSGLEFAEWIEYVPNRQQYLQIHLIPEDPSLWYVKKFGEFLEARCRKIIGKFTLGL